MADVTQYRHQLRILGINDEQVKHIRFNIIALFFNIVYSFVRMCLSLVFALPGLTMLLPLGLIVAYFAEAERRKALAGSEVKVKAVDVMASVKVAACLVLYPFQCVCFTLIFYQILCRHYLELSHSLSFELSIVFAVLYPLYSIVCIRSSDGVVRHLSSLQARLVTFFNTDEVVEVQ